MPNYTEQLAREGNLLRREPPGEKAKRKRIPSRSPKKVQDEAIYKAMLPGWLKAHPVCEVCPKFHAAGIMVKCKRVTTHPHHIAGRRGALLYTESNLLAACAGEGHPKAVHETHRQDAERLGILIPH